MLYGSVYPEKYIKEKLLVPIAVSPMMVSSSLLESDKLGPLYYRCVMRLLHSEHSEYFPQDHTNGFGITLPLPTLRLMP